MCDKSMPAISFSVLSTLYPLVVGKSQFSWVVSVGDG